MSNIVGIDLGTSTSEVAIIENGKPVIIHNFDFEKITPSVVGLDNDGNIIAGRKAADQFLLKPNETAIEVKRLMGSDEIINMGGVKYSPVQISSYLLSYIKEYAEEYLSDTVDSAVITVPAYFNEQQRKATVEAGIMAGLKVERIINEPTAAALCYGIDNLEENCHVMVYDFGGGTFDVTILEMFDGVLEVKASSGNNKLGGKDFDERIINYLLKKSEEKNNINLKKNIYAMVKLKEEAEKCKIALSEEKLYEIIIPFIAEKNGNPISVEETITREIFEELILDLVEQTQEPINVVLSDSGLLVSDIDVVLLVGGSTRVPMVKQYIEKLIGKKPEELVDPDLAVASGAAIQAGILSDQLADDIFITDVNPYALGVKVFGYIDDMPITDVMSIIIPRNVTIPVTKSDIYFTNYDFQTEADIEVYQGDKKEASNNNFLGKFRLSGIPPAKSGKERVSIQFSYDSNGLLKVEGTIVSTNEKAEISIDMTGVSGNGRIDVSNWMDAKNAKKYRSVIKKGEKLAERTIVDEFEKEDLEDMIYDLKKALITNKDTELIEKLESEIMEAIEAYM